MLRDFLVFHLEIARIAQTDVIWTHSERMIQIGWPEKNWNVILIVVADKASMDKSDPGGYSRNVILGRNGRITGFNVFCDSLIWIQSSNLSY
jgi:hypothetical protein